MKTAIAYCRSNRGITIEGQIKIDTQIESITNYAFKKNINIKSIFINNGLIDNSKASIEREFSKLIRYLKEYPEIKYLIITEVERLSRDNISTIKFFSALNKIGVKLISTRGEDYINSYMLLTAISCSSQRFRKPKKS